jgi:WXG100 family type VII secretion target
MEQIASQFSKDAQQMQDVIQRVRASYGKLADKGWIGLGANAFFEEMESKIFPSEDRLMHALEHASQGTQKIAQTVKQAEEQAASLFRGDGGGAGLQW